MAGDKEVDEVYVIYLDGKMYKNSSREIVYLTKGRAKSVVTSDSKRMAEEECRENPNHKWLCELSKEEQEILMNKQKQRFEIRTFVPKDNIGKWYMGEMLKKPRPILDNENTEYDNISSPEWYPKKIVKMKLKKHNLSNNIKIGDDD